VAKRSSRSSSTPAKNLLDLLGVLEARGTALQVALHTGGITHLQLVDHVVQDLRGDI
jgi:hypothetical protein